MQILILQAPTGDGEATAPRAATPQRGTAIFNLLGKVIFAATLCVSPLAAQPATVTAPSFTLDQLLGYPFVNELTTSSGSSRIAWVFNRDGVRNVWTADAPDFKARPLTAYTADDGQELTNLTMSPDGRWVIYVRGGDHDANWPAEGGLPPDPDHSPVKPKVEIWAVRSNGSRDAAPRLLAEGDEPVMSPRGDRIAFIRDHAVWVVPVDGSHAATQLFFARGSSASPTWSPDGSELAFVSNRGDHSFIGIFTSDSAPIRYMTPSTSHDNSPRWSPDGTRIAFVRTPGTGGAPESALELHPRPWSIWTADATTGVGHVVWTSPNTLRGSVPTTDGGTNLMWAASHRIVFLSDADGWPHLYSIPESGGPALLLTPGAFMDEFIALSSDRSTILYSANAGGTPGDGDRRHVFRVPVDHATPVALTSGDGLEWSPEITGDGSTVAFIGAGARTPMLPMVMPAGGGARRVLAPEMIPSGYPASQLVIPRPVQFRAPDGTLVHGQLFESASAAHAKRPGIVFVHGGPPRQMLLGWNYMDYYSNSYAVNQFLATHGFVVLSVNYRLGIGYGHDYHHPAHAGAAGASEYQDVKAGAEYLRALPAVDSRRIGIWGGSYGGYLTALALARNSDIFKAGVDMHGVHNWITQYGTRFTNEQLRYEKGDIRKAIDMAWKSSPDASISTWKSPVLLIQGDDDRNVYFHETVDLARRLDAAGVPFDELVIPDEIHGFLRHQSWLTADSATVRYFARKLGGD